MVLVKTSCKLHARPVRTISMVKSEPIASIVFMCRVLTPCTLSSTQDRVKSFHALAYRHLTSLRPIHIVLLLTRSYKTGNVEPRCRWKSSIPGKQISPRPKFKGRVRYIKQNFPSIIRIFGAPFVQILQYDRLGTFSPFPYPSFLNHSARYSTPSLPDGLCCSLSLSLSLLQVPALLSKSSG